MLKLNFYFIKIPRNKTAAQMFLTMYPKKSIFMILVIKSQMTEKYMVKKQGFPYMAEYLDWPNLN